MLLQKGSQKSFYKGIQGNKIPSTRCESLVKLATTIYAVQDLGMDPPTPEHVWKSIWDPDIPRSIRGFLWKCMHNAYKIGEYWSRIPNYDQRSKCALCGEEETMEHILVDCDASQASKIIWNLARQLWLKREKKWPKITIGTILGANLVKFVNKSGKTTEGKGRLFKILLTESAHLIWKLRCERTIKFGGDEEKYHTDCEIHNRWLNTINSRLKFDGKIMTDTSRFKKYVIKESTVLKTWSGVLRNEDNLPDNWIHQTGVLVGMAPRRPPGRNQ